MAILRFKALELVNQRKAVEVQLPAHKISDYYGSNVFGIDAMRSYLSGDYFKRLQYAIKSGSKVDRNLADAVAAAMRTWAMSKGATHYTHWFQPLTGETAEKHDSFFDISSDGRALETFKGNALVQQEPDASSFPSGGIRNTFEARGYTAWDPTSPAFIIENAGARTLCIPTIFVSYTGEALDFKAPLLKSLDLVERAALDVCQYFDKDVTRVTTTLGIEQEYFLVDRALYDARPDLVMTGRTVFGHAPAKGQQLEDHYFGAIPSRVHAFMVEFEAEAHKLGIPLRTRHNEVAPNQFECAPTYEEANLAVDHNQLLMDIMDRVAEKHHFKVLLHEKPFKGVNGSGKHNNWAMSTDTGVNLLGPGRRPKENLQFLTFFITTIKAVHRYADLLRASIASASNDHRLGANEAPPAIMSVFIGTKLSEVLDELERTAKLPLDKGDNVYMKLGIDKIPEILLDNTDRNRTSPFAFTGNKFEFRAVGSSANCANAMTVLNAIVADQLIDFRNSVDALMEQGKKKEVAIIDVLREYVISSKAIRFEGNGYSKEWEEEAERRGLSNIRTTPQALDKLVDEQAISLFTKHGIFNERELHARHDILLEDYLKRVQIESRVMGDLALNHVIPTAVAYQTKLVQNIKGLREIGLEEEQYTQTTVDTIKSISKHLTTIKSNVDQMIERRKELNKVEDTRERSIRYCEEVTTFFDTIRYSVDKLELIVDDEQWPLVKYREMMFSH